MSGEWTNEDVFFFLECYQAEPCIWDPSNKDHKDKKKVADAWSRVSKLLNKPVKELKAKKEILMVTFRKHLKKKQDCIRSGAGIEDIYEPSWFAYNLMESFLLPIYTVKLGINSETNKRTSEIVEEMVDETEEAQNVNSLTVPSTSATTVSAPITKKNVDKSRRRPDLAEQQMATAFSQLTDALSQRKLKPSDIDDDECDLYGKLLAKKIRELPKEERNLIMYEIDTLFIERIKRRTFSQTPSPQYFQPPRPASASSGEISNRPPRVQSSYSEPYSRPHSSASASSGYISNRPPRVQSSYSEPYPGPHYLHTASNTGGHTFNKISDEVVYEDFERNNPSD